MPCLPSASSPAAQHRGQVQEDIESLRREMDNLHGKYIVAYC